MIAELANFLYSPSMGTIMKNRRINVATTTRKKAGSSRRARRAKNAGKLIEPLSLNSLSSKVVIKKPEMTKKTSTPIKPPENPRQLPVKSNHAYDCKSSKPIDFWPILRRVSASLPKLGAFWTQARRK